MRAEIESAGNRYRFHEVLILGASPGKRLSREPMVGPGRAREWKGRIRAPREPVKVTDAANSLGWTGGRGGCSLADGCKVAAGSTKERWRHWYRSKL